MNGGQTGAVVGGIIGAGVGFFVGMPQLGFAIGWTAGGWVGGALDPPKTELTDFGAQAFPPFNTALRGSTIKVLFGTNRVSSHIVYQGNYQTLRSEGGADTGGKGGGSGGGGAKGAQGPRTASYEYKLDIVYHLGMSPAPIALLNGWIGAEQINGLTIQSVANYSGDSAAVEYNAGIKGSNNSRQKLSFDSATFFPGDLPNATAWTPLSSETGIDARWPGTAWIGIEGLSLGERPVIPQISWEVGNPGNEAVVNGAIAWRSTGYDSEDKQDIVPGSPDVHGNIWLVHGQYPGIGDDLICVRGSDGLLLEQYANPYDNFTDWLAAVAPTAPTLPAVGINAYCCRVVGDKMFVFTSYMVSTPANAVGVFFVCTIGSDGSLTPLSASYYLAPFDLDETAYWGMAGLFVSPDAEERLLLICSNYNGRFMAITGPSISEITGDYAGAEITYTRQYLTSGNTLKFNWPTEHWWDTSHTFGNNMGFILPIYTGLVPAVTSYKFCLYASPEVYIPNTDAAAALTDYQAALPNGGLLEFEFDATGLSGLNATVYGITYATSKFSDGDTPYTYFTEDAKDYTTGAAGNNGYSPIAYVEKQSEGVLLVIFHMAVNADPSYNNNLDAPFFVRFRAYVWDATSETFNLYVNAAGPSATLRQLGATTAAGGSQGHGINRLHIVRENENELYVFYTTTNGTLDQIPEDQIGRLNFAPFTFTGYDVYPPYIIKQILVNSTFGLYPGKDIIDEDSYDEAVAYCEANNLRVSTQYTNDGKAQQHIEMLLAIYDGYLVVDVTAGKIKFGVTDLTNTSVRTIDNQHLVRRRPDDPPVNTTKGAKQDTYNLIRVNYIDRLLDYKTNQIEEGDEVDQDVTGIRMREFPPDFVMTEYVARRIASRALWNNLYTRDSHQFYLTWRDADLEPGDVITLVDSYTNLNQVVRIARWKEVDRGLFEVDAAQMLQYIPTVDNTAINSSFWHNVDWAGVNEAYESQSRASSGFTTQAAPPLKYANAYELPIEFSEDGLSRVHVGWVPDGLAAGANLYVSADGDSFALGQSVVPYPVYGLLLNALPVAPAMTMHERLRIAVFASSYSFGTGVVAHTNGTINEVSPAGMHNGTGLMWVGSEMIAYNGVTLVSQNVYELARVYRGWGGTVPGAHSSLDLFWRHDNGLFEREYTVDQIGRTIIYKVVPFGFDGNEYNIASISPQSYTILGTHYRPGLPSAIDYDSNRGMTRFAVNSTIDIPFTWKDSARQSGFGVGGGGTNAGGFGGFTVDPVSLGWRVTVTGSGNSVVRSTYVTTPAFTYTSSMNAADNGAWRGTVAVNVMPRNQYGDALASSVLSMELFA